MFDGVSKIVRLQTLNKLPIIKQHYSNIIRRLFFMHCSLCLFSISSLGKVLQSLFQTVFSFHLGDKKKWLLVVSDRWQSYTVTVIWEFAWVDSALVVLDEWLSYGGGRWNRFDCKNFILTCRHCSRAIFILTPYTCPHRSC